MALIQDQPEDLPTTDALTDVEDPDAEEAGGRAEIFLSGAHVATLDNAPDGLGRVTLMVELEVTEEATRFTEDGMEVPIRRCRRVGDMWRPGTPKPPTREEIKAAQAAAKAKAQAEQMEAERAEQDENEPPMFDDEGNPIDKDAPQLSLVEDQGDEPDQDVAVHGGPDDEPSPEFSDLGTVDEGGVT